jgi:lipoyl(octanoyl) transferase
LLNDLNNNIQWKIESSPVDYATAVKEMEQRAAAVACGEASELIWLLEHPHVYTAGTSAKETHVLSKTLCPVIQTGRGGQVTYHGPGQRVVYLILDLNKRGKDVRAYVHNLEEWIIQSLNHFDITCNRREGRVGLWVARTPTTDDKIAAIGVRVKKWITLHGIAINLNPDLSFYNGIVPCGITNHGVTSIQALGHSTNLTELDTALQKTFPLVFAIDR